MDGKIVQEFSQLRVLPQTSANRNQSSSNRRSLVVELCQDERKGDEGITRMDALVQDLNSALEESTRADMRHQNGDISNVDVQQHPQNSKRRAWRRRCKSTSNLASIASKSTSKVNEKLSKGATRNIVSTTEQPSTEMGSIQNDNSNETGKMIQTLEISDVIYADIRKKGYQIYQSK